MRTFPDRKPLLIIQPVIQAWFQESLKQRSTEQYEIQIPLYRSASQKILCNLTILFQQSGEHFDIF